MLNLTRLGFNAQLNSISWRHISSRTETLQPAVCFFSVPSLPNQMMILMLSSVLVWSAMIDLKSISGVWWLFAWWSINWLITDDIHEVALRNRFQLLRRFILLLYTHTYIYIFIHIFYIDISECVGIIPVLWCRIISEEYKPFLKKFLYFLSLCFHFDLLLSFFFSEMEL